VGFPVGVPPARRMIVRAVRNVDQRCNASRLDNLNSTRPSRRRPAKEIRSTTLARLRCRDGLNSAVYLQKPKQPRPFKLLPGRPLRILVNDPSLFCWDSVYSCPRCVGSPFTYSSVSYILYTLSHCTFYCSPFLECPVVCFLALAAFLAVDCSPAMYYKPQVPIYDGRQHCHHLTPIKPLHPARKPTRR